MKNRTLLVDSNYLLKRSVNGAKDMYSDKYNGHIGGLYSFITTIRKLVKLHKINKVILMWDGENGGKYRYKIDKAYKANRKNKTWYGKIELTDREIAKEKEKELSVLRQRKRIQEYVEELFFRQIEVDYIEADDLIAQYCIDYHKIDDIYIYTNDRDYAQLLDLEITIIFENLPEPITKNNFMFYFKYNYNNALPMKIICGDTSDNIAGIKGLAESTLLKHFPDMVFRKFTVRDICLGAKKINEERILDKKKPLKAFTNLLENVDRLKMNFKLTNLKEPILNATAREELELLKVPLSDEDRGSKNLIKLFAEDGFLDEYSGNFTDYVQPFYTIIMNEKAFLKKYMKNK